MIGASRINSFLFLLMFFVFLFTSKFLLLFNLHVTAIDYIAWSCFVILLFAVNYKFLSKKILLKQTYLMLLLILLLFCVLNYFFVNVPIIIYLQGTFFTFLFAANFILFYNIRIGRNDFFKLVNTIIFFLSAIAVFMYLERIFIAREYSGLFLRGVQTIAKDPGFAATLLNINIVLCLGMFIISRMKKYIYLAVFSFITISLLMFFKSIVSSLIVFSLFGFVFFETKTRRILFTVLGSMFLILLIILGKPFYEEFRAKKELYFGENSERTPRNSLYVAGFQIAADYFPFGCGQGTFGSYPVGKNYSKVYYKYGLDKVYGLGPDATTSSNENFLFDTYWSHILGEMGFIATFFFLWLWFFPALKSVKFLLSPNLEAKALSFIITLTIIVIFVESFALSIPEQLQFILLYSGLGAFAFKLLTDSGKTKPTYE